jgi:plastocyanin
MSEPKREGIMGKVGLAVMAAGVGMLAAIALAPTVLAQAGVAVKIANFKFGPETVTVAPNAAITWSNTDGVPHQIIVSGKKLQTAVLNKGQEAQLKIAEAGTYDYVCGIHPSMKGKIVVK